MSLRARLARWGIVAVGLTCLSATVIISPPASAATIMQGPPTSGSVDVGGSAAFTDTLTGLSSSGPVTFATSTPGFAISGGDVLGTTGTLSASGSPYIVNGSDSDSSADSGSWSYSLTVTPDVITQGSPTSGSVDVGGSGAFTVALTAVSGFVGPVTFTTSTPGFAITSGDVLESTGTLGVSGSPYTVSGSDSDAYGDTGSWSYTLTVTPDTITQGSPMSGSVTATDSPAFTATLAATSGFVGPVTFATSTPGFAITSGDVLESTGALGTGGSPYTVSGSDSDAYGDTGSWAYSLTVSATVTKSGATITQTSPTTGTVVDTASQSFSAGPIMVAGNSGPVTFITTKSSPALTVSPAGLITSTNQLSVGTYVVSGTDADTSGGTGMWTYTLSVTAVVSTVTFNANGGAGSMPAQSESAPTALALNTFTRANYTFVDWNTAADGSGVAYANGAVFPFSSSMTLYAQWKSGKSPRRTITFSPNGGKGAMPAEVDNTPTAISPNRFTRAGYTFVNWSSSPKGSGAHFGAGATYNFKKSVTLYARWKKIPAAPLREVTFFANGGAGQTVTEHGNKTASLTPNHFVRKGFTFLDWNTMANGNGTSYANGASYSFTASTNLYAQWKKPHVTPAHKVTFSANGGVGTMAVETSTSTRNLTVNQFTRAGYTFTGWNTGATGLGTPYANGAVFSFNASVTLYAQWKSANATEITAGPFAHGSSSLSSALESQIQNMADMVKSKNYTQIALLGYGDGLTSTQLGNAALVATNAALGRTRAQSVAVYLEARLAALGVAGWSISISGAGAVHSGSAASTVIATLS